VFEVSLPSSAYLPDIPFEGKFYKGVFGAKYNIVKSFMLRNHIEGPSWIRFKSPIICPKFEFFSNFLTYTIRSEEELENKYFTKIPTFSVLSIHVIQKQKALKAIYLSNNKIFKP
jgi:hypothetical protein